MSDPTADAAKLLRMLEEANGVLRSAYQIAARDGLDTNWSAFKTTVENILTIQHEAGIRWNTRPQPAPPAGEPDFVKLSEMFADEVTERERAADLLERLAGELVEREAELAKADAVIAEYVADDVIFDAEKEPTMKSLDNQREAQRRHAARQQQKASAEPTASSKTGETR